MDVLIRFLTVCLTMIITITLLTFGSSTTNAIELVGPDNQSGKRKSTIYGPVKGTDTLWRIAFNNRPDPKLTVDQVMIAIFLANPQAFKNNDIHSITDGTLITIPSAKDISSITDSAAKLRIANNAQFKTPIVKPAVITPTPPIKTAIDIAPIVKPVDTQVAETTVPKVKMIEAKEPMPDLSEVLEMSKEDTLAKMPTKETEPEEAIKENPALLNQLTLAMSDMQLLIKENEALRAQIKGLDEKLAEMQTQEALDLQAHEELLALQEELAAIELAKDMDHASIFNNGWVVAILASLPSIAGLAGFLFWFLRKRKDEIEIVEPTPLVIPEEDETLELESEDELIDDDLLISDDDDDMLEIGDIDELDEIDDELLVPTDFDDDQLIDDQSVFADEEEPDGDILGQDDLEALLAQADDLAEEDGDPELSDEIVTADDIDSLLAEADSLPDDDDIDALLAEANAPVDEDDIDALLAQSNESVGEDDIDALLAQSNESVGEDDIDALLAEANTPVGEDDIDALLAEANEPVGEDDIDALLAEANEPVGEDDIDALLAGANEPVGEDDIDIDALLAGANEPVGEDDIDALLAGANDPVGEDDIDALLAGANEPVGEDDIDALLNETESLVEDTVDTLPVDDIDSLLAETDAIVEEASDDIIEDVVSSENIDDLLAETDAIVEDASDDIVEDVVSSDNIDDLLAETDALIDEDDVDELNVDASDIDSLLAETDALVDTDNDELPDIDDIDELLTDTDALLEPEASAKSLLEELSELDMVEQPYLMTSDADETFESLEEHNIDDLLAGLDSVEDDIVNNVETDIPVDETPDTEAFESEDMPDFDAVEEIDNADDIVQENNIDDLLAGIDSVEDDINEDETPDTEAFESEDMPDFDAVEEIEEIDNADDIVQENNIDDLLAGIDSVEDDINEDEIPDTEASTSGAIETDTDEQSNLDTVEDIEEVSLSENRVQGNSIDDLLAGIDSVETDIPVDETPDTEAFESEDMPDFDTVEEIEEIDNADDTVQGNNIDDLLAALEPTDVDDIEDVSLTDDAVQENNIDDLLAGIDSVEDDESNDITDNEIDDSILNDALDELDALEDIKIDDEPDTLVTSEAAQHLVNALDGMLDASNNQSMENSTSELDEFIIPQAIEVDDNELTQTMAEFDEDSVISESEELESESNLIENATENLTETEQDLNEQLSKFEAENSFIDIDKLLDDSAMNSQDDEPYQNVDLDIGLDEFPEMLPDTQGVDVDDDPNGLSKKLDLARAYLEIDDEDSALEMLEQIKQSGDESQLKEVEKLLKRLKS